MSAQEKTNSKGEPIKFINVNGRVIPIKAKKGAK